MKKSTLALAISSILMASSASAATIEELQNKLTEQQAQLNALVEQMEAQSTQESQQASASKSLHIGGYGELHYNNLTTTEPGQADKEKQEIDFHRFVLYFGHDFNENIRFFSELEIEHAIAGEEQVGEVELEQAYIEIDLTPNLKTQAGMMLVPVGILNETHEPETFYGVERNAVEKNIIPTTWWGGGLALKGITDEGFSYDLMVSEGLYAEDGYSIRSGRQKTAKAKANNLAYTARLKYTAIPGLELAATARHETDLGQGQVDGSGAATLLETHAVYQKGGLGFRALYAQWDIAGDAAKAANADQQNGFYIEPSYKINENWGVFTRYSEWNKTTINANLETQTDVGVNFWPHPQVVFKADYQAYNKDQKDTNGFNLAVGYSF